MKVNEDIDSFLEPVDRYDNSVQDGTTAVQEAAAWRRSYKTGYIKIRTKERRKLRLKIMLLIHLHDTKSR